MNENDYIVDNFIIWLYFIEEKYVTSEKVEYVNIFLWDSDVIGFIGLNTRFSKRLSKHKTLKTMQCKQRPKSCRICWQLFPCTWTKWTEPRIPWNWPRLHLYPNLWFDHLILDHRQCRQTWKKKQNRKSNLHLESPG